MRGFQFRFYPTAEQKAALAKTFGSTRYVYNWALDLRSKAWTERQEYINYHDGSAALTRLKQELPWLNEVSCVPVQQSLRHLETAFVNFWKHGAEYPAFKSRSGRQSAEFTRSAFRWRQGQVILAKIGKLKIRWTRRFRAKPTTVTVSRTPAGQYYVSFRVDERLKPMPAAQGALGIDLGLSCFAADSHGRKHHAPRPLRRKMAQLKRAQKALARKKKGSKNRDKARRRVARIHQNISDIRCDFQHQPSSKLCSTPGCGFKNAAMPLEVREWTCPGCGITHDRDINAARNLLAEGLSVNACGGDVRPKPRTSGRGNCRRSRNLKRCA